MNQINTEREQRFIDLAAGLADDFAERSARHDEEASFPHENYARMRESGYTILTIPEKFGGLGANMKWTGFLNFRDQRRGSGRGAQLRKTWRTTSW